MFRMGEYDPNIYSIHDFFRASNMVYDTLMLDDEKSSISGSIAVVDLCKSTTTHFLQYTPTIMKKSAVIWQVWKIYILTSNREKLHFGSRPS